MKNRIKPENAAKAKALESLLREHGIMAQGISFHDTAYDGLFQAQYDWGVIRVADDDHAQAAVIVRNWKKTPPTDIPWDKTEGQE